MSELRAVVQPVQEPCGPGYAVHIPTGAVLPEWMVRTLGLWDDAMGERGLRLTQPVLFPLAGEGPITLRVPIFVDGEACGGTTHIVHEGQDVAELLGLR